MNRQSVVLTQVLMGTSVTIEVVHEDSSGAIDAAFEWFRRIEACCSRFNPESELMQVCAVVGIPVPVSPMLYAAVEFALAIANESDGALDPTVGSQMASRDFNREYSTGRLVPPAATSGRAVSFRDVQLDPQRQTITLDHPLVLDLGAVAKGLAVDAAARELQSWRHFAIDAGGDLYFSGDNPAGERWKVGIRHPLLHDQVIDTLRVTDCAVCTSGNYERRSAIDGSGHILDPRTGDSAAAALSATVVAPTTMMADALATAAFVLGPVPGIRLLDRLGVEGLIFSQSMERHETEGLHND